MSGDVFGGVGNIVNDVTGDLFGTKKGTIQTQGSNAPWAPLQPYLTFGFQQARNLYDKGASPFLTRAANLQANTALSPGNLTNQAQGELRNTISGQYLNPATNPAYQSALTDALGRAGSVFAKQYGGFAGSNLSNSGYREELGRTLGQVATNANAQQYNVERQNQLGALALAPTLDYANAGALYNAGTMADQAQFAPLARYQAALMAGLPGFGQTTSQNPYYQNQTAQTLGALASGAGAFMALSDRKAKKDIRKIGERKDGIGIFEFRYQTEGDKAPLRVGFIADDVARVKPHAVSERDGMQFVDYGEVLK